MCLSWRTWLTTDKWASALPSPRIPGHKQHMSGEQKHRARLWLAHFLKEENIWAFKLLVNWAHYSVPRCHGLGHPSPCMFLTQNKPGSNVMYADNTNDGKERHSRPACMPCPALLKLMHWGVRQQMTHPKGQKKQSLSKSLIQAPRKTHLNSQLQHQSASWLLGTFHFWFLPQWNLAP